MRLKLIIAYDGAPFSGWQSQPAGDAVQDAIEGAFRKICGTRIVVHGSGRTDAGVHALGQCAHADVPPDSLSPAEWLRALNANLPPSIRILKTSRAAENFHARFSAKGKIYRYLVRNAPVLPPHEAGRVWHVPQEMDLPRLKEAAACFAGRHDFAAFSANRGHPVADTQRRISQARVVRNGSLLSLTFEGDGFLYKMVRMLTGAACRAALGREDVEALRERLKSGGPKWSFVAPAEGLYLVRVIY